MTSKIQYIRKEYT